MSTPKIALALACVFFLTGVTVGQVERPLPGPEFGLPLRYEGSAACQFILPRDPFVPGAPWPIGPGQPPPYEGWEPWHNVKCPSNDASVAVPEPGSLVSLIGGGLCLLGWVWRTRRQR